MIPLIVHALDKELTMRKLTGSSISPMLARFVVLVKYLFGFSVVVWRCFFFTLLSYTPTPPVSRFRSFFSFFESARLLNVSSSHSSAPSSSPSSFSFNLVSTFLIGKMLCQEQNVMQSDYCIRILPIKQTYVLAALKCVVVCL